MRYVLAIAALALVAAKGPRAADDYRQLTKIEPLPVALDRDFAFRKTKTFVLGELPGSEGARRSARYRTGGRDAALSFEASYRLFGAVTDLDRRQRYGRYFDFFWRAKRPAQIKVRLEYQQEKLRAFTQAREVTYPNAKGSHKTSFAIIGDDFFNDGHVLAWRCVLIETGRIVAEERSYLWGQLGHATR
jgi:hypothetical protein